MKRKRDSKSMTKESSNLLNSDYADMARSLLDAGVEFMLVGGYAVSVHGYPRTTFDIDFGFGRVPKTRGG